MGFWPIVLNVLKNSDMILLLVDARMPEITRNSEIIEKAEKMKKRLTIIFNKSDLIRNKEIKELKKEYPQAYFVSGKKKTGIKELKNYLINLSENWNSETLRVGLVGYPNVGKSTLINLLAPSAKAKVSPVSGTTKKTQWIRVGKIRIMDSPGVIPFGDRKTKMGITSAKDPHKIKNPEKVAIRIIEFLKKRDGKTLEKFYGVKEQETDNKLFLEIGKKMNYLIRGGEVDENRTAIKIIRDWQSGKINLK